MRFALTQQVFDEAPSTLDDLDRLLERVADEVHTLGIADGDAIEKSAWFKGMRPHRRDLVRNQIHAASYPARGRVVHVGSDLPLEAAARLAFRPLLIAVENKTNDGLLVEVAVRTHGDAETVRLWDARPKTGKAIDLVHGGGTGDLRKEVDRLIADASSANLPMRAIVVTDGDARWPGEIARKAAEIEAVCATAKLPCVVLGCRAAENYIPDGALRRWADEPNNANVRGQVDTLLSLSSDQRDHIRMKGSYGGLRDVDSRKEAAPPEQVALFASVTAPARAKLVGFRDDIIRLLREYINRPDPAEIAHRDPRGDLRKLVQMIEAEL